MYVGGEGKGVRSSSVVLGGNEISYFIATVHHL